MDITVTILDEEKDILESWIGIDGTQAWLQHAIDNKIRQRVDASILEVTDKNPSKLSKEEKLEELKKTTLPTREDRMGEV